MTPITPATYVTQQLERWGIPKVYRQLRVPNIPDRILLAISDAAKAARSGRMPILGLCGGHNLDAVLASMVGSVVESRVLATPEIITADEPPNMRVLWLDWPRLAAEIRRNAGRWTEDLVERVDWAAKVRLLLVVGIGEEVKRDDRAEEALQAVLSARHDAGLPTCWTSAVTADDKGSATAKLIARYPRAHFDTSKIIEVQ